MRSANTSRQLTEANAVEIWCRRLAGEAQHVLAADYKVNPGRIADVLAGRKFPNARAMALDYNPRLFIERNRNKIQPPLLPENPQNLNSEKLA